MKDETGQPAGKSADGSIANIIGVIMFLALYFGFGPMVNNDTCRDLRAVNPPKFNEEAGKFFALC